MISKKYIRYLTAICITPLVRLIPRKRNKWVFGAMQNFKDNPKYFFYWTRERHPEIRAIWIAQQKSDIEKLVKQGCEAYYWRSLKGLYHALTAKVYVSDHHVGDINIYFSGGAFFVNLWHGSSVKRVRWQAPQLFVKRYNLKSSDEMRTALRVRVLEFPILFRTPDLCLAPSTTQAKEFFAPMMDIPLKKCIVGVYPRSRLLLEGKESALNFIEKYEPKSTLDFVTSIGKYNKVYIYMPTWRNDGSDFISKADIDWGQINSVMEKKNELFILKLHPLTHINATTVERYSHIKLFPTRSDIYTVLPFIDTLVTDYSSIYTDFLTMDKEVILFLFDYEEYVSKSYELSEFNTYFIARKAYHFEQLLTIMKEGLDCHIPSKERKRLLDFFWDSNEKDIDLVEVIKKRI